MRHPKLVRIRAALRIPGCVGPCRGIRANMEHTSMRIGLGHCVEDVEDAVGTGRGHRWKGIGARRGLWSRSCMSYRHASRFLLANPGWIHWRMLHRHPCPGISSHACG
jgi:hypothetical protein